MEQNNATTIEGTTTEHTTGPYGNKGCDKTMHVVHNGEDVYVPFNAVRASGYDSYGSIPKTFDVNRIGVYNGNIHAEADVEEGIVELYPDYNLATSEFKGYERWTLQMFDADTPSDTKVVWERD